MGQCMVSEKSDTFLNEDEQWEKRARNAKPIVIIPTKFKTFEPNNKIEGQSWRTMNVMSKGLGFDIQVINQLYSLFCIADLDNSGQIDIWEFLYFLRIEDSPFSRRLFGVFDTDNSMEIDLLEFACAVWNISTWPEQDLSKMLFYIYDEDNSGYLELDECRNLIADVYGARKDKTEQEILQEALFNIAVKGIYEGEYRVYLNDFLEFAALNHELISPLRCMFTIVRKSILGSEYWDQIGSKARTRTISTLLDIVRGMLGPPGAEEAVNNALVRANKAREKELQKKRNEKLWGNASEEDGLDSRQQLLRKKQDEARHRAVAVNHLHKERSKRYDKWLSAMNGILNRGDPLSILLKFSNREFVKNLRDEFDSEWNKAMATLQEKMYDREGRLETLVGNKPGKEEAYFMRKHVRHLTKQDKLDSDIRYSSAPGMLTWVERRRMRKKEYLRALRHAGGNLHLAKPDSDDDDNDDEEEEEEKSDASSDEESSISSDDDEYQVINGWRKKRRNLVVDGIDVDKNVPTSTRSNCGRRQYPIQNAKRPSENWKQKHIQHLKDAESGALFSPNRPKPYFTYRGKGRKNMNKVYVVPSDRGIIESRVSPNQTLGN